MTKSTILLAEDDEIMRVTLSDYLAKNGWLVDEASDGQDALEKLRKNSYELVISDIRMPRIDGFGLLDEIRQTSSPTHIIFMTAYGCDKEKAFCLHKGAAAYLLKPFEMEELLHRIQELLGQPLSS